MKHVSSFFLALFTMVSLTFGQSETRNLSSFDEVSISSGINATLVKGSTNKAEVEAEGIELDKVVTDVSDGELKVQIDSKWWKGGWGKKRKVNVVITYTEELHEISTSAGSRVTNEGVIKTSSLELSASSGSNTNLFEGIDESSQQCHDKDIFHLL